MSEILGRVVLITGAASGIAAAVGRRFTGPDCALILHTRGHRNERRSDLEKIVDEVKRKGGQVLTLFGDLADDGVAQGLVAASMEKFGRLKSSLIPS